MPLLISARLGWDSHPLTSLGPAWNLPHFPLQDLDGNPPPHLCRAWMGVAYMLLYRAWIRIPPLFTSAQPDGTLHPSPLHSLEQQCLPLCQLVLWEGEA